MTFPTPPTRRARRAVRAIVGLCLLAVAAALPTGAAASEGPPERPSTRHVMFVGNNWDGTADLFDPHTFEHLGRINTIPDKEARLREIRRSPDKLAFFLAIRQFVGEGNDQYTDDMFTTHNGRLVAVSRPSFADVVGISLRTGRIEWRFPMEGYRSDHMAVSPDGRRLLVSDSTANVVHELNLRTGEKTGEFPSGDSPHESNYSEDGSRVFHASIGRVYTPTDRCLVGFLTECLPRDTTKGDRRLQIVDANSLQITDLWRMDEELDEFAQRTGEPRYANMDGAVRPMALSPNERFAYLQISFHHGFVEFDLEQGDVTEVVDLPIRGDGHDPPETYLLDSAHHGLAMNPRGSKLCVAGTMSDYAAIVARRTFAHDIVSRGTKPYWSTNGPDGRLCWVSYSGDDEVAVIRYGNEREVARLPVGDHPQRVRVGVVRRSLVDELPEPPGGGGNDPGADEDGADDGDGSGRDDGLGGGGTSAGGGGDDRPSAGTSDPEDSVTTFDGTRAAGSGEADGSLPFTGLALAAVALIGSGLLGGGIVARRATRRAASG